MKVIRMGKMEGGIDWGIPGLVGFEHQKSFKTQPPFPLLYPQKEGKNKRIGTIEVASVVKASGPVSVKL